MGRRLLPNWPEDATDVIIPTRGRFYPASGITPAVIALDTYEFVDDDSFRTRDVVRTWIVSDAALSVFERFGVPVVSNAIVGSLASASRQVAEGKRRPGDSPESKRGGSS